MKNSGKVYKRFGPAAILGSMEALGQMGGGEVSEEYIGLCSFQTIESGFRKYLPRDGSILEAGAGRGRWVIYLRRLGYDVTGIEIARAEIAAAKAFDPSVPIEYRDVLKTGYSERSFDAVISLGVLEHFEDGPEPALAEVRRILKPGGLFLVTVPTQNFVRVALFNPMKNMQNRFRRMRGVKLGFEEYRYSRRQFEGLLRGAGFSIIERAPDDFRSPLNMGLYTDSRLLHHRGQQWRLNSLGNALNGALGSISPWLHCSGTLWVCRSS